MLEIGWLTTLLKFKLQLSFNDFYKWKFEFEIFQKHRHQPYLILIIPFNVFFFVLFSLFPFSISLDAKNAKPSIYTFFFFEKNISKHEKTKEQKNHVKQQATKTNEAKMKKKVFVLKELCRVENKRKYQRVSESE